MKFLLPIALFLAAAVVLAYADDAAWNAFKSKHGKMYKNSTHEAKKRANFEKNVADINSHNQLHAQGKVSYSKGVNHLTDMSGEEIKNWMAEHDTPVGFHKAPSTLPEIRQATTGYPAALNWASSSCMPPVKDQGQCGDCYAFAATGVLEFLRCSATNQLVILSEQSLTDCSTPAGNAGCNGGLALQAWNWVIPNGQAKNATYPYSSYTSGAAGTCQYTYNPTSYNVNQTTWGYTTQTWNETSMIPGLNAYGPIAVSIDATYLSSYAGGVYDDPNCSTTATNHAVILVGYGTDTATGKPFWILRNSWSALWGEAGYFRMVRGKNMCAIAKRPVYAVINGVQPKV